MLTEKKKKETARQIHQMMKNSEEEIIKTIEFASASGALTEDMKRENDYTLAKMLIHIYFEKMPYKPYSKLLIRDMNNLSLCI